MRELLYIAIGDPGFGIWDDEVLSINENINLHHIPLTGDIFAGIIQIDGRVATVADLAACTGFQRMKHRQCQVLLLSEKEDIAGFAIEQKVRRYEISTENILKLPDCLHSQIVDTCVIYSSKPIPVINIKALYGLIKNKEYSPQTLLVPDVYSKPADLSGIRDYKYIKVGNELFAFPDRGLIDELPAPGVITASVLFPKYVKGVTLYNNSLLPLVSLARKMKIAETGKEEHTIIMEIEKNIFGFLSDSAAGNSNELIKTAGLPPIARSPWMKSAIIDGGKIIPVIDPAALIMPKTEDGTIPVDSLYLPENSFENNFGERDADVTEFLILNTVYSLPRSEVKDTIPCGGIRRIPGATPVVIGVSEYEGELIPVLDPALYFGVYSQV
ncbi:MAG: chemotaxis protein CheW, partial [Spirochaetes bacterium]|nr:chemotaxis protein CheW [Spirochaetota bacterium]